MKENRKKMMLTGQWLDGSPKFKGSALKFQYSVLQQAEP